MAQAGNTVIDIELLATSMENKFRCNQLSLSPNNCIFRTPCLLARHNEKAYTPNYFSFGPFHHGQEKFMVTEEIKIKYLGGLLSRSNNPNAMLRECLNSITEVEGKARECYAGNLDHLAQQCFVELLVVDGCFIIEVIRKDVNVIAREADDPIFSMACMFEFLSHDLILLENQIPWLVLQILFEKTKAPHETMSLLEIALKFVDSLFPYSSPPDPSLFVDRKINHILHLLRLLLVLPSKEVRDHDFIQTQSWDWAPIPSAFRLKEAGVKIIGVQRNSILDVCFRNGVLEIPSYLIHESTETLFRNLISYEQCLPVCSPTFTSYAKLMDNLINTTDDMEILCKQGIFDNWLSPEDSTLFFNKLYRNTCVKYFCYSNLCVELHSYYQRWWPKWRAAYVHNYFTKPWVVTAQIYAVLIFILTFWQAYKSG